MSIQIRYYAPLRGIIQKDSDQVDAVTVKDVLNYIQGTYGKPALKAAKASLIVVNDVSIGLLQGFKTALKAGDVVGFLPLCGGG